MTETDPTAIRGTASALLRAFKAAPVLKRGIGVTLGLAFVGTAMQVIVPIFVQQIVDDTILLPDGVDVSGAATRGALALVAVGLAALASWASVVRLVTSSATGLSDLRVATFGRLHRLSILHVEAERRGALVSRVTSDVSTIQDFMDWGGVGLMVGTAQVVLALIVMFVYEWRLAALVAVGVVMYAVLLLWFQKILQRAHDRVRLKVADSMSAMGEAISGVEVVRAYGAEEETLGKVGNRLDAQFEEEYRTGKLGAFLFSSAEVFAGALTAAVIAIGLLLGAASGVSAGTLLAFLFLVNLLVDPVQLIVEVLDMAQRAGAGLRRILEILDTKDEITEPAHPQPLPPGGLGVSLSDVDFAYPSGEQALRGVSAEIAAGRRVAVVGETGSGKTTFAKVVTRLLEAPSGSITIGDTDLREIALANLRNRVAFVPQEGFLFDATIADNVRYGKPDASDADVARAFAELDLGDWVDQLDAGLATHVGERGGRLSAGERQLVALVRAWIADPDLLVLDEATSAVDPALDVRLRNAIEHLAQGRTSITIAHRLATAETADEVLVFSGGELVEAGPHRSLVTAGGTYAALHADWATGTSTAGL
jgi:putative ABC transport system ATP-binding protein